MIKELFVVISIIIGLFGGVMADTHMGDAVVSDELCYTQAGCRMVMAAENVLPVLEEVKLTNPLYVYNGGDSVEVDVKARAGDYGVAAMAVVFKNKSTGKLLNGGSTSYSDSGCRLKVGIPEYASEGLYKLERVVLEDSRGDTVLYYNSSVYSESYMATKKLELSAECCSISFTVGNSSKDVSGPVLLDVGFAGTEAKAGEDIAFRFEAKDDVSGVAGISVDFVCDSGYGYMGEADFTLKADVDSMRRSGYQYMAVAKVDKDAMPGEYHIKNVVLTDKAGNSTTYVNPDIIKWNKLYGLYDTRLVISDELMEYSLVVSLPEKANNQWQLMWQNMLAGTNARKNSSETASAVDKLQPTTGVSKGNEASESATEATSANAVDTSNKEAGTEDSFVYNSVVTRGASSDYGSVITYGIDGTGIAKVRLGAMSLPGREYSVLDNDARQVLGQELNVCLSDDGDGFPVGASFTASKVVSGIKYRQAREAVKNMSNRSVVLNLDVVDAENNKLQPQGFVGITVDMPVVLDGNSVIVCRLSEDGRSVKKLYTRVDDDRIYFETDHFSTFIIMQSAESSPPMGDDAPVMLYVTIFSGLLLYFVVCYLKKCANSKN